MRRWVAIDVSKDRNAYILRCQSLWSIKMKALRSFEMSVNTHSMTRRKLLKNLILIKTVIQKIKLFERTGHKLWRFKGKINQYYLLRLTGASVSTNYPTFQRPIPSPESVLDGRVLSLKHRWVWANWCFCQAEKIFVCSQQFTWLKAMSSSSNL